jgi:hypothetical protein
MLHKESLMNTRSVAALLLCPLLGCNNPLHEPIDALGECDTNIAQAVAWDARTEVGLSAAQAFSGNNRSCSAPFAWDASPFKRVSIKPPMGQSSMTVRMTMDPQSARIERPIAGSTSSCRARLAADADATLSSEDGAIAVSGSVTLMHDQVRVLAVQLEPAELNGSLQIGAEIRSDLAFLIDSMESPCAGRILLNERPADGSVGITDQLGAWSDGP